MNAVRIGRGSRQVFPHFFGGKYERRRDEPHQGARYSINRGLRRAPPNTFGRKSVEAIFQYIEIERAQIHGTEIVDRMIGSMKFKIVVPFTALPYEHAGAVKHPRIELPQFVI